MLLFQQSKKNKNKIKEKANTSSIAMQENSPEIQNKL
jgi:hypothetical protein